MIIDDDKARRWLNDGTGIFAGSWGWYVVGAIMILIGFFTSSKKEENDDDEPDVVDVPHVVIDDNTKTQNYG